MLADRIVRRDFFDEAMTLGRAVRDSQIGAEAVDFFQGLGSNAPRQFKRILLQSEGNDALVKQFGNLELSAPRSRMDDFARPFERVTTARIGDIDVHTPDGKFKPAADFYISALRLDRDRAQGWVFDAEPGRGRKMIDLANVPESTKIHAGYVYQLGPKDDFNPLGLTALRDMRINPTDVQGPVRSPGASAKQVFDSTTKALRAMDASTQYGLHLREIGTAINGKLLNSTALDIAQFRAIVAMEEPTKIRMDVPNLDWVTARLPAWATKATKRR